MQALTEIGQDALSLDHKAGFTAAGVTESPPQGEAIDFFDGIRHGQENLLAQSQSPGDAIGDMISGLFWAAASVIGQGAVELANSMFDSANSVPSARQLEEAGLEALIVNEFKDNIAPGLAEEDIHVAIAQDSLPLNGIDLHAKVYNDEGELLAKMGVVRQEEQFRVVPESISVGEALLLAINKDRVPPSGGINNAISKTHPNFGYTNTETPAHLNDENRVRQGPLLDNTITGGMPGFFPRGEEQGLSTTHFPGALSPNHEVESFPSKEQALAGSVFSVEENSEDDELSASLNKRIEEINQQRAIKAQEDKQLADHLIVLILNTAGNRRTMSDAEIREFKELINRNIEYFADSGRFDLIDSINRVKQQFFPELND